MAEQELAPGLQWATIAVPGNVPCVFGEHRRCLGMVKKINIYPLLSEAARDRGRIGVSTQENNWGKALAFPINRR